MRPSSVSGRPPRALAALVLSACVAALGGCGTAGQSTAAPGPGQAPAEAAQPAPTSTAEVEVLREGGTPAVVSAVTYKAEESYDRVVVELQGEMPGYSVKWVNELIQDGSGKPLHDKGKAFLELTLSPANAHTEQGQAWAGGPVYASDLPNVTRIIRTSDFEGHVGIGLVLARQAPFQVREQTTPTRLILDVAH
ncbi:hypothetical protein AB0L05_14660 [Nonomuraea pusilla]|uniref:AMIN-like domain-containing (lipo)protein n=1 Tax=Nonomuraea pusilla TaxID=46177 RepID=UPI00332BA4D6